MFIWDNANKVIINITHVLGTDVPRSALASMLWDNEV